MSLQPTHIGNFLEASGLQLNVKPVLLNDAAFCVLENAYVYRGRVIKRQGLKFFG